MGGTTEPGVPKRRKWGGVKKALVPRGKVPAGIRGLTRAMHGELASERAKKWDAEEIRDVGSWITRSPAWAISIALHFVAAVVLMNVVYFTQSEKVGQMFRMTLRASVPGGNQQGDQDTGIDGKDNEDSAPKGPKDPEKPESPAPVAEPPKDPGVITSTAPVRVDASDTSGKEGPGGIYAGRGGAGRGSALRQFGGDGQSEQAVIDGLEWLARHQEKNGAWLADGYERGCPRGDSCGSDDRGMSEYTGATTGLSILAFLGAGYSHKDDHLRPQGEGAPAVHAYTSTVARALKYLVREQGKDGLIDPSDNQNMYVHGIASLALVEGYSMTHDPELRGPAQRCVNLIVDTQQDNGGWDYGPVQSGRGDISITSWMVMCLRSARAANLAVPKRAWDRARKFTHASTDYQTGNIAYCVQGPPTRVTRGCNAMIAIGMATRAYLGMPEDQDLSKKMVDQILGAPPRYDEEAGHCANWGRLENRRGKSHASLYYTYYATLALFHHGGQAWDEWNAKMRACTLVTQAKTGHRKGSWDPVVWDGQWGGRVYTTAFNIMNLEVYYRYLPCYQVGSDFGLAKLVSDTEWDQVLEDARKGKFSEVTGREDGSRTEPVEPEAKPEPPKPTKDAAALIADLASGDMMTRRNAAKALTQKAEVSAIPALIHAAKTEPTSLRPVLVEYLGAYRESDEVIEYLISEVDSGDERIARAAHTALTAISGEQTMERSATAWRSWRNRLKEGKKK
ncbi:MAG: HEAT repeat domain-containing protein [Candidatus Brocadiae bacterium]|nr:HEAT repeat domain-containing protein [Candidatus Brocadiia bacterium]